MRTALLLSLVLSAAQCGGKVAVVSPEAVVDSLLPEEHSLQDACAQLNKDPLHSEASPNMDTILGALASTEATTNLAGIYSALGANKCDADKVLRAGPAQLSTDFNDCRLQLEQVLQREVADVPTTPADKFLKILRTTRLGTKLLGSVDILVDQPLLAARSIDLSPAVVYVVVAVANGAEELADTLADNVPYVSGLARLVLRQLAAELVAATMDAVLSELESSRVVNPASVARSSCKLYGASRSNGVVADRALRRAILRFQRDDAAYPLQTMCEAGLVRGDSDDACALLQQQLSETDASNRRTLNRPSIRRTLRGVNKSPAAAPATNDPAIAGFAKPKVVAGSLLEAPK